MIQANKHVLSQQAKIFVIEPWIGGGEDALPVWH
jgi:hypothetical protein